jgi:hypothetical protein
MVGFIGGASPEGSPGVRLPTPAYIWICLVGSYSIGLLSA